MQQRVLSRQFTILVSFLAIQVLSYPAQALAIAIEKVAGGERHSVALRADGTVWAWGENSAGQVGAALSDALVLNPAQVIDAADQTGYLTGVVDIAAGTGYWLGFGGHSLAAKDNGTAVAWGNNSYGQLGDGTQVHRSDCARVKDPSDPTGYLTGVVAVGAGDWHSLAVKSDGTVWAWGSNSYGQLGDGTTEDRLTPVQVAGLTDVTAVAAGYGHCLALKKNGTVWAWGGNGNGQLGDGTTFSRSAPVQVSGLAEVVAIEAGDEHSLALKSDGTMWVWGANPVGQLGLGTAGWDKSGLEPARVTDPSDPTGYLSTVIGIAAGDDYSLALKSDGTVWAWGANNWNQLGDGTSENRTTPVQVSGLADVVLIGAGNGHSLAIKQDGTVWAWGGNWSGQLGDGTTEQKSAPVQVVFTEQEKKLLEVRGPYFVTPGEDATFLILFENTNDNALEDAVITFEYPSTFTYVASTNSGSVKPDTSQVFWKLGTIAPGTTGGMAVKLTVPWGYAPHAQGSMHAEIGAKNLASDLDPDEYLGYEQDVVSVRDLTAAEILMQRSADEKLDVLLTYATANLGYVFQDVGREIIKNDGSTFIYLTLLDLVEFNPVFIYSNKESALIQRFHENKVSWFDTEGGYTEDLLDGSSQSWGSWAGAMAAQAGERMPFLGKDYPLDAPEVGKCLGNCMALNAPDWFIKQDMMEYQYTKTNMQCQVCAQSVKKAKDSQGNDAVRSFDQDACAQCAREYKHASAKEEILKYEDEVAQCASDCKKNPDSYVCYQHQRYCDRTGWQKFRFWTSPEPKVAVAIPCVNGKLVKDKSKSVECAEALKLDEVLVKCKEGICYDSGDCSRHKAPLPPYLPPERLAGPVRAESQVLEFCEDGCLACYQTKQFEIVVAHDPNAKYVDVQGNVLPGELITYSIEYENEGQGTAYDVFVLDKLDPDLDATTLNIQDGGSYSEEAGLISWEIGAVPAGGQGTVSFSVQVKGGLANGTEIINYADVHFPSAGEITPTNPVVTIISTIAAEPQTVAATAGSPISIVLAGRAAGGGALSYAITADPFFGTLAGTAPNLTYTSMDGFSGQDEFSFAVSSGQDESEPAKVIITVAPNPADTKPPAVASTYPGDNATDIHVFITNEAEFSEQYGPMITATFTEPAASETITADTFTIDGLSGSVSYDEQLWTAYFLPTSALNYSTTYTARLSSGIKDKAGNAMAAGYSWRFTTESPANIMAVIPPGSNAVCFGNVMVNQTSPELNINIMNSGSMDLAIGQVAITGDDAGLFMVTDDGCSGLSLAQSGHCIVKVAFVPDGLGDKNAQLEVPSNDADTPVLEVPLCGSGVLFACPLELAAGEDRGVLPALRLFRNRVLARDSRGRGYIQDYYAWAVPLAELLLRQPDLARRSLALLSGIRPEIERLNDGRQIVIPAARYSEGLALLDIFIQSSGGAMQERLRSLKADLQDAAWLHQLGIDVH